MLAASQVRAAVAALLMGATPAGPRVYLAHQWPLAVSSLPALRVGPGDETMDTDDITWPQLLQHELELQIEGLVAAVDDIDDAMDALVEAVLLALLGEEEAATLQPLVGCTLVPVGISRLPVAEGQAATGRVLVRLRALYQTVSSDPSTLV